MRLPTLILSSMNSSSVQLLHTKNNHTASFHRHNQHEYTKLIHPWWPFLVFKQNLNHSYLILASIFTIISNAVLPILNYIPSRVNQQISDKISLVKSYSRTFNEISPEQISILMFTLVIKLFQSLQDLYKCLRYKIIVPDNSKMNSNHYIFGHIFFIFAALNILTPTVSTETSNKYTNSNKQFVNHGDVYFLVSEPESLRYTFRARSSRIGIPFEGTLNNIALVLAEPRDACASSINKLEIKGNVALVERGGCSFLEKCIEIARSGGIALIVYDYDKHNDENYIEMIDDNTSRNCSIPAVSLLGKDGYMIVHSLLALKLNRAVITIPINVAKDKVSNPPWLMW